MHELESNDLSSTGLSNAGDVTWILVCAGMVWLMVPGIGFFYSGMARTGSALSLIILCCWSLAVVSIQWFFFGYSLAFGEGSPVIGNLDHVLLLDLEDAVIETGHDNKTVPAIVFCLYQQMLAGITPALVIGATAERGRLLPTFAFMFFWTTFVYDFLVCWTWGKNGWMHRLGVLDFAGGTPIHIAAGAAAIAYARLLGQREKLGLSMNYRPHNLVQVVLGTSLIWFGWFGFNGGSVLAATDRAANVIFVTNLSASVGGITWALCDYYLKDGKLSALSFCFGAVAGLVSITPASGYIAPWAGVIFGFVGALVCHWAIQLKDVLGVDDALDVAAVHGVCGFVGTVLTGVFAQRDFAGLNYDLGWMDGNYIQILYQLAGGLAGMAWSLVVTYLILWVMNKIPGLRLGLDENSAKRGIDFVEMGESAYEQVAQQEALSTQADSIYRPLNGNTAIPLNAAAR